MINTIPPKILVFVGMAGSGKSVCIDHIFQTHPHLPSKLYFGGITVDEVKRRGWEVNEKNEKIVREELRATHGKDHHARRIVEKIDKLLEQGHHEIIVDGLYSWSEYKVFKERYGDSVIIISIAAPRHVRHERLSTRPIRPLNKTEANSRDYAEIESLEKGGPIANADYTLVNDSDQQHLFSQLDRLIEKIGF